MRAIISKAFPKLQFLDLGGWRLENDEKLEGLLGALAAGRSPDLRSLDLRRVGVGPQGAAALVQMLNAGSCKHLEVVDIGCNEAKGDEGIKDTILALKPYFRLREFGYGGSGEGSQASEALFSSLRNGPYLEKPFTSLPSHLTTLGLQQAFSSEWRGPQVRFLDFKPGSLDVQIAAELASGLSRTEDPTLLPVLDTLRLDEGLSIDWEGALEGKRFLVISSW